jgi:hypothetical protein
MALTTYTAGEVLTAASLNDNFTFAAANPLGGLVAIVPTSVAVGSGTGSSSGNGLVTFAGVSSVSLNGVFSSTYNNYRIMLTPTTASTTGINVTARLRQSGTDITTASSYVTESLYATDAVAAAGIDTTTLWYIIDSYNTTRQEYASATMDLFKPFNATIKTMISNCHFNTGSATRTAQRSGTQSGTATCDGITISASTGTIGGTISVYGYSL